MFIHRNVRSVLFALVGLACIGQVAEAKKVGPKEFTAAKVENDAMSVGVTRVTLKPNGVMSFSLLVQSKSDRTLTVDKKGFVLSAGGHEFQRNGKILAGDSTKVEKGKPATITFEFNNVPADIKEAALRISSVFRLKADQKDQALPDLALTMGSAGANGSVPSDGQ